MNLICPDCNCYIISKRAHKKYCSLKMCKCRHELWHHNAIINLGPCFVANCECSNFTEVGK